MQHSTNAFLKTLALGLTISTSLVHANSVTYLGSELLDKELVNFPNEGQSLIDGTTSIKINPVNTLEGKPKLFQIGPLLNTQAIAGSVNLNFNLKMSSTYSKNSVYGITDGETLIGFNKNGHKQYQPYETCTDKIDRIKECIKLDVQKEQYAKNTSSKQSYDINNQFLLTNNSTKMTTWINGIRFEFSSTQTLDLSKNIYIFIAGETIKEIHEVSLESDYLKPTSQMFKSGSPVPLVCHTYTYP